MTDAEGCRIIAEFEDVETGRCEGNANVTWPSHDREHPWWKCSHGRAIGPHEIDLPDYPHDLNATMRAARKLPNRVRLNLEVSSRGGEAWMEDYDGESKHLATNDPARAAYECLLSYLKGAESMTLEERAATRIGVWKTGQRYRPDMRSDAMIVKMIEYCLKWCNGWQWDAIRIAVAKGEFYRLDGTHTVIQLPTEHRTANALLHAIDALPREEKV